MRILTIKDGDFESYFGEINENTFNNTTLREILNDNHTNQANKRELLGQLPLENFFGFCNAFDKVPKN